MRRNWLSIGLLCVALFVPQGCNKTTTTPPLAPGYQNATDQTLGETLAAAHAFYQTLADDAVAGKWTPSPQEKTALNALAASLNVAQPLYLAYHSGQQGVTAAQVQAAVTDVVSKQSAVQAQIGAK